MKANDTSVETTELVLKVLDYAHEQKLDINSVDDVTKILQALNSTINTEAEIREFMVLLKVTDKYFDINAPKKISDKQKLSN